MGKHYQKPVKPNEKSELRFILSPPPKGKLASGGKFSAHVEHDQTLGEEAVIGELADSIQPPLQKEFVALVIHRLWLETPDGKTAIELTIIRCDATRMTFAVPDGIAAGDYVLVAQRMNPDRRSFARARYKVRI